MPLLLRPTGRRNRGLPCELAIRRVFHAVEWWIVLLHILTFLGFVPIPMTMTSSNTLRGYMCVAAIIGGFLGYLFSLRWAGEGRPKCIRHRTVSIVLSAVFLSAMIFFLQTLSASWVMRHPSLKGLREELIVSPTITNCGLAISAGLTLFFAISAVTLSSPKLWNTRLKDL
jgi:hypothetical protein